MPKFDLLTEQVLRIADLLLLTQNLLKKLHSSYGMYLSEYCTNKIMKRFKELIVSHIVDEPKLKEMPNYSEFTQQCSEMVDTFEKREIMLLQNDEDCLKQTLFDWKDMIFELSKMVESSIGEVMCSSKSSSVAEHGASPPKFTLGRENTFGEFVDFSKFSRQGSEVVPGCYESQGIRIFTTEDQIAGVGGGLGAAGSSAKKKEENFNNNRLAKGSSLSVSESISKSMKMFMNQMGNSSSLLKFTSVRKSPKNGRVVRGGLIRTCVISRCSLTAVFS